MRNTVFSFFAPYRFLILLLCGATCQFYTVQPPHTLPMRCHLPISHRTASSCSAYAVLLAILAPYRFLTLYLYGAACCFCPHCEAISPARTKKHTQFFAKPCIQASPHSIHIKLRTAEAPRGPRLLSLYYLE